eukprot:8475946-Pyramimonas_sp.AAC.1
MHRRCSALVRTNLLGPQLSDAKKNGIVCADSAHGRAQAPSLPMWRAARAARGRRRARSLSHLA